MVFSYSKEKNVAPEDKVESLDHASRVKMTEYYIVRKHRPYVALSYFLAEYSHRSDHIAQASTQCRKLILGFRRHHGINLLADDPMRL